MSGSWPDISSGLCLLGNLGCWSCCNWTNYTPDCFPGIRRDISSYSCWLRNRHSKKSSSRNYIPEVQEHRDIWHWQVLILEKQTNETEWHSLVYTKKKKQLLSCTHKLNSCISLSLLHGSILLPRSSKTVIIIQIIREKYEFTTSVCICFTSTLLNLTWCF